MTSSMAQNNIFDKLSCINAYKLSCIICGSQDNCESPEIKKLICGNQSLFEKINDHINDFWWVPVPEMRKVRLLCENGGYKEEAENYDIPESLKQIINHYERIENLRKIDQENLINDDLSSMDEELKGI